MSTAKFEKQQVVGFLPIFYKGDPDDAIADLQKLVSGQLTPGQFRKRMLLTMEKINTYLVEEGTFTKDEIDIAMSEAMEDGRLFILRDR